ncbi:MAG: hypothetical protein ACJA09_003703 [Alcanivorax sp.]|jgi:hypothetical protein
MDTLTVNETSKSREVAVTKARIKACYPVTQLKLDLLNLAMFTYLYKSGRSEEQICRILELSVGEFRQVELLIAQ